MELELIKSRNFGTSSKIAWQEFLGRCGEKIIFPGKYEKAGAAGQLGSVSLYGMFHLADSITAS
jgi:hypothetical protein